MSVEARIVELSLELPPPPKPGGVYHPVVIVGDLAYVSGQGPIQVDGTMITIITLKPPARPNPLTAGGGKIITSASGISD